MKTKYFPLAIALTLLLVFGYGVAPTMRTGTAAPAPADDAPFKGKVLVVTMDYRSSSLLEHAQVRKIGDRSFLVGKGVDDGHPANWTKGQIIWLPMARVDLIVEFGSVEEMKKARKAYEENMPAVPPGTPQLPGATPSAKQPQ